MAQRTRSDSPTKTCTTDGCGRPLRARGLCSMHWRREHGKPRVMITVACGYCGTPVVKVVDSSRPVRYCSYLCRDLACADAKAVWLRERRPPRTIVPDTHPARWIGISSPVPHTHPSRCTSTPVPYNHPARRTMCTECGEPQSKWEGATYCSRTCSRRSAKRRRRAREYEQHGTWTWCEFTKLCLLLGNRCAYCNATNVTLEPDHVVALSRGGHNTISNLLPSCRSCNAHKRNLTLDEWQRERLTKGLAPLALSTDAYTHLALRTAA